MKKRPILITIAIYLFIILQADLANSSVSVARFNVVRKQQLTPPEFPGGQGAFTNYMLKNLKWPKSMITDTTKLFHMSFFVEKDGSLTGLKIDQSISADFDNQVIQAILSSPKWIPATADGKPIKSKYLLPLRYQPAYGLMSDK